MNPRRIHDLIRSRFPAFSAANHEWINIAQPEGPNAELLESILHKYVTAAEVLVEVHRKEGALLPLKEAVAYIASKMGQGEIRVADREFKSFVVVAANGVATGWQIGG